MKLLEGNGFRAMLARRQLKINSLLCVGLDPLAEKVPLCIKANARYGKWQQVLEHMKGIVDATAPFACMFKPQLASYSSLHGGDRILIELIAYIKDRYPDIPIFLDCKKGDIGRTQQRYRVEVFEKFATDGANFSPYMGKDCMEGLFDPKKPERALVGLAYTSNPAARQIQNKLTPTPDGNDMEPLWLSVSRDTWNWAKELGVLANAGLVMAAAHKDPNGSEKICFEHLELARAHFGNDLWYLIPGIGTQKGFIIETVDKSFRGPGSIAINSSSKICFASDNTNFGDAAAGVAEETRDEIREAGGSLPMAA